MGKESAKGLREWRVALILLARLLQPQRILKSLPPAGDKRAARAHALMKERTRPESELQKCRRERQNAPGR